MKVLTFGITREIIGAAEITLSGNSVTSVEQLRSVLTERYPKLSQLNSLAIAVNEVYANDEIQLNEEDVVALIPPVSGG
ncbi:MAG: MoaD/ThiS family protein [Bacteroidia bacterium]|nr:MoaD/ThiS family protein [Bacteroidia bacterium]